jgi:UDP-GlcNAc:undecaprenyl-phosphate GlcNAc-1-phosphate transferase
LSPVAHKIQLIDIPSTRKTHRGNIPLIGGIAIAIGLCISLLLLNISLSSFRSLLAGFFLLVIIGVLDDFKEVSARTRIFAQIIVGILITCWGGIQFTQLGHLLGTATNFSLGAWAIPLTVLAVVALINANNMLDGLNGLAGGSSFMTLSCLLSIAECSHAVEASQFLLLLCSCVLGFLCFNLPVFHYQKRLVFLGDAGSTGLGLMLAWFGIQLTQAPFAFLKPAYLPWLFILPICDLISVTLRRSLIKHVSPLSPDREHIHHLLESLSLPATLASFVLIFIALGGGLISIFMAQYHFSEIGSLGLFIILLLLYIGAAHYHWQLKSSAVRSQAF